MNRDFTDIEEILIKSLTGRLSGPEKEAFDNWIGMSPDHRAEYELLEKLWLERSADRKYIHSQELMEKIWSARMKDAASLSRPNTRRSVFRYFPHPVQIAAGLIFLLAATFLFHQLKQTPSQKPATESLMMTKINPKGQKSRITLPDGSLVWLNSASSIAYDGKFSSGARHIELKGEAFFEVNADPSRPFIVTTGNINTTALGTSFNITAYDLNNVHVSLVSGKAKVEDLSGGYSVHLNPGEGIKPAMEGGLTVYKFDPATVAAWKDGILVLNGESLQSFKDIIEKWYGVSVQVEGRAPDGWSIRGRFDNESLENLMKSISYNKNFKYELNDKTLKMKF